jgi:hypothetical protein
MTRLEKIILEQTRKSKPGTVGQTVSTNAVNQKAKQLKAISFLLYYVFGKKQSPIDKPQVASVLPKISIYGDNSIYSRGEYFYVIGEDYKENEGTNKAVIYYPIYIIRQSESDIEILNKFRIGGTDKAPIIDINDFQNIQDTIKKKKAEVEAAAVAAAEAKAKEDAAAKAKEEKKAEEQKLAIQSALANSEDIDLAKVGKDKPSGTPEQKAFQELLYQVGLLLAPASNPQFAEFAKLRLFTTSGKYEFGGVFGDKTNALLWKLDLDEEWNDGMKKYVLDALRGELLKSVNTESITTESTNYFKGTGMNIKLKDLLQEHLLKEQVTPRSGSETYPGNSSTAASTNTTTSTSANTTRTSSTNTTTPPATTDSTEDVDNLYTQSVTDMSDILLKMVTYVNNHEQFSGYKMTNDDEEAALNDLVKPYFQTVIQPLVTAHYKQYIQPYMVKYGVNVKALTVYYGHSMGFGVLSNPEVEDIKDASFKKMVQNYLMLRANSTDTALNHPINSAFYYNYTIGHKQYTIPHLFYYNFESKIYFWNASGARGAYEVDSDF